VDVRVDGARVDAPAGEDVVEAAPRVLRAVPGACDDEAARLIRRHPSIDGRKYPVKWTLIRWKGTSTGELARQAPTPPTGLSGEGAACT